MPIPESEQAEHVIRWDISNERQILLKVEGCALQKGTMLLDVCFLFPPFPSTQFLSTKGKFTHSYNNRKNSAVYRFFVDFKQRLVVFC